MDSDRDMKALWAGVNRECRQKMYKAKLGIGDIDTIGYSNEIKGNQRNTFNEGQSFDN